jgi:hypothetical protein
MPYGPRNNSGVMFPNSRKPAGSKQPEWRGEVMIHGAVFEIAGWVREAKNGRKFLALNVQVAGSWRTQPGS